MNTFVLFSSTIFICFAFHTLDRALCESSGSLHRSEKLKYAHFREYLFHNLDVPKVEEASLRTRNHCLQRCVKNPKCFSANIAAFYRPDGNMSCDLLPTDKYSAPEKFRANHSFHHYSILVSCGGLKFFEYLRFILSSESYGFLANRTKK